MASILVKIVKRCMGERRIQWEEGEMEEKDG